MFLLLKFCVMSILMDWLDKHCSVNVMVGWFVCLECPSIYWHLSLRTVETDCKDDVNNKTKAKLFEGSYWKDSLYDDILYT